MNEALTESGSRMLDMEVDGLDDFVENTVSDEDFKMEEVDTEKHKKMWIHKKTRYSIRLEEDTILLLLNKFGTTKRTKMAVYELIPNSSITKSMTEYDPVHHGDMRISVSEFIDKTDVKKFLEKERKRLVDEIKEKYDFEYISIKTTSDVALAMLKKDFEWQKRYGFDEFDQFVDDALKVKEALLELDRVENIMNNYEEKLKKRMKNSSEYKEFMEKKQKTKENLFDLYQEKKEKTIIKKLEEKENEEFRKAYVNITKEEPTFTDEDNRYVSPTLDKEKDKVTFYTSRHPHSVEHDGLEWRRGHSKDLDTSVERKAILFSTEFKQYFFQDPQKHIIRNFLVKIIDKKPVLTQIPSTIETVEKAIEYTKTYELKELEKKDRDIVEFGDYYFVEMKRRNMEPEEINSKDDQYTCKKSDEFLRVTHPYYGSIDFENSNYKPIKKKSAQIKEKLTINNFSLDQEKYRPDLGKEKKQLIDKREEELMIVEDCWDTEDGFLEPISTEDYVAFLEPKNYITPSEMGIRWIDREDADENFLLVTAGEKLFWHGRVWGTQCRTFLLGKDDSGAWFHQVPTTIDTVEQALDYMEPAEVKKARKNGREVKRQGDIYFKEMKQKSNMDALENTKHDAEKIDDGWLIKHPEHEKLELKGEWKAIQNNTASRPGTRGRRLAD